MLILGLTGSIAMGKSTAAKQLRRLGLPLHDSDAVVHRLLAKGGAGVGAVARAFPGVEKDGAIDRQALGRQVFADPQALKRLEAILHPLVRRSTRRFLQRARRQGCRVVVLDIPLLFETKGERLCDAVLVVSAPAFLQRQRALRRPGMTPEKLRGILARQVPDFEKRRRAFHVIPTGLGKGFSLRHLKHAVRLARERKKKAFSKNAPSCS